ncbi:MAG: MATE family efflux transporter [Leptospiraceae bacterium]|nr:MATE family efflux transporter [Leptospiraceae bacterium]MCK6381543.1 MATE family efflux transporter [Leptospiraceae bacterium]
MFHKIKRIFQNTKLNFLILSLSLPVFLEMISHTMIQVADTMMVGKLGEIALGATGLGGIAYFTILSFILNASSSVQILTARRVGEKNFSGVGKVALSAIGFAIYGGILFSLIGYFLTDSFVQLLSDDQAIIQTAGSYIKIRFLGSGFFFVLFVIRAFLNGLGLTYIGMIAAFVVTFSNIFLNWVLIYGNLGFQAYGVDGAAMASSLAGFIGMVVISLFLLKREVLNYLKSSGKFFDWEVLKEIFYLGFPPGVDGVLTNLAFLIFTKFAGMISTTALAASSIVFSIMTISFMPGFAFGIAATTLVGQALGAGKIRLAYQGTFRAASYSAFLMGFVGLVFIIFGKEIISLFSTDPIIICETYPALFVVSLIQVGDAYHMVVGSALRSTGLVYWVMVVYIFVSFFVMLPLGYYLGVHLKYGTVGLWSSVFVWILSMSVAFVWKFRKKEWVSIRI